MSKSTNPISRANLIHKNVDKFNNEVLKDPIVQKHLSCKKGCTACCHSQVSVTQEETSLLAELIKEGIEVDLNRLFIQKSAGNSAKDWFQLAFNDRKCVFLNDSGECKIYENRPAVCRTNFVISDPTLCDTSDGVEKPIRLLNTFKSDMVIYAAFSETPKAGALPLMLWEELEKMGRTPIIVNKSKKSPDQNL